MSARCFDEEADLPPRSLSGSDHGPDPGSGRAGASGPALAQCRDERPVVPGQACDATKSTLTTTRTRHSVTHHTEHGEQDNPSEDTARCLGCIGGRPGVLGHARHGPDSREYCTLPGVTLRATSAVAEVKAPFRYNFRYPVPATVFHESRWHHYGSLACSRTGLSALGGERGWERPPFSSGSTAPQSGLLQALLLPVGGRSQPAPAARTIPAGRLLQTDGTTRVPVLVDYLGDSARAPHHLHHHGLRRVPRVLGRSDSGQILLSPSSGAHRQGEPDHHSRFPRGDRHIPARPNGY